MRIKYLREELELTQQELSNKIGISRGSYSLWELEIDPIPLKRLNDLANIFNVSVDYILELTNTKNYTNSKTNIDINKSKERIKEIRKEKRHTQEYLGKKFSLDRSLISKYESGETLISTTFLIEYAKLYKISCDYLIGKIDNKIKLKELVKN